MTDPERIIVGLTGASGVVYGVRLVEALLAADPTREVHLIVTRAAERVMAEELSPPPEFVHPRLIRHANDDVGAAPASGTFRTRAMVVCPCSMNTLGALASGRADTLLTRAADVTLKEGRPLAVAPRETPLSLIHLRNLASLAEAGVAVIPLCPPFYSRPRTVDDLVRRMVQKIFDRLALPFPDAFRWDGTNG